MSDIAHLNIPIDSTDADKAAKSLDNLADYAEKAEKATDALGQAAQNNAKEYKNLSDMANDLAKAEKGAVEQLERRYKTYAKTAGAEVAAMQAAEKSANTMSKYAEETEKLRNSLGKLLSDIDPLEGKLNKLDETESKLHETFRRGVIDAEKYAESLAKIGSQRDDISQKQLKEIGEGADYAAGMMEKLGLGTRQAQTDLLNLGRGAAQGNLRQVQNSIFSLTRSSGALSSMLVGVGAVVGTTVGSMALLGAAYYKGYQSNQEFNKSIALTGNALGVSAGNMARMTDEVGRLTGSYSQAEQAVNLIVRSGRIASDSIQDVMQTAVEMQQIFGQSVDETISEFERLGDSPSATLLELNEKYRFLTAAVYEQVRALEDQGRIEEATKLAQIETSRALGERTAEVLKNVGAMERAWLTLKGVVVGTWEAMANIGKDKSLEQSIAGVTAEMAAQVEMIEALEKAGAKPDDSGLLRAEAGLQALKERRSALEGEKKDLEAINELERSRAQHQQELLDQSKFRENFLKTHTKPTLATDLAKANEELKKVTAGLDKESVEYAKVMEAHYSRIKEIEKRHKPKGSSGAGATNQWAAEAARLRARIAEETSLAEALENTVAKVSRLNEFERKAMQLREQASKETKVVAKHRLEELAALNEQAGALVRNNKLTEEAAKERLKYLDGIEKSTQSTYDEAQKLRDQAQTMGMSRVALEQLTTARLQEEIAQLRNKEGSEEEIKLLEDLLAARENLTEAVGEHEMARVAQEAQKEMEQDWKRTVEEYDRIFRDGFAGMINDGKDGWKSFTKSLATTFKTSVADQIYKMFAQPFIAKVAVSMAGGLGMGSAASAMGGGGVGDVLGLASNANMLWGAFSGGLVDSMASGIGTLGEALGSATLTSFSQGMSGALAAEVATVDLIAGTTTGGLSGAGGAGSAFAAAAPWLAGAAAVAGAGMLIHNMTQGETRTGGGFIRHADGSTQFGGGPSGGYGDIAIMDAALTGFSDSITSVFDALQLEGIQLANTVGSFESSKKGRGGTSSGGTLIVDGQAIAFGSVDESGGALKGAGYGGTSGSAEEMFESMTKDFAYSTLEAFQAVGDQIPSIIQRSLSDMDIRALTPEQAQSAVGEIQAIVTNVNLLMSALDNLPFTGLKDLSFDLAASLLEAAGGMDVLIGGIGSYYQGFFSEQERFEMHAKQLETAISELGLGLPDTKQGFRGLMESLDAMDEANHATIAGLFKLSDAAGTYYDYLEHRAEEAMQLEMERAEQMGSFRDAFYSDAELHASLIDDLRGSLQDLGHELPDTRRGFRDLVDALDAADESNHAAIDSLLGMAGVADKVYSEIERQADEAMRKAQESSQSMALAAQEIVASFEKAANSIHSTLAGFSERIQLDIMKDDEERYAYHKQTFDDLARQLSQANDMNEIQDLVNKMTSSASSAYNLLDEDVRKGGKGQEYLDTINRIQQEADQRMQVALEQKTKAEEHRLKALGNEIAKEVAKEVAKILSGSGEAMNKAAGDISGAAQEFSYAIGTLALSKYNEVNS